VLNLYVLTKVSDWDLKFLFYIPVSSFYIKKVNFGDWIYKKTKFLTGDFYYFHYMAQEYTRAVFKLCVFAHPEERAVLQITANPQDDN